MDGRRLDRVIALKDEYTRLKYKVDELQAQAEKCTSSMAGTVKGGVSLKDDAYAKLIDYKNLCQLKMLAYINAMHDLDAELDCIADTEVRTAMKYYYVDGVTQSNIAAIMGLCDKSIQRYIRKGRIIYENLYDD